jgi:prepilin-type processing-associated H-X9-DG protein
MIDQAIWSDSLSTVPADETSTSWFAVSMGRPTIMECWPGNYHNLGCMFSFADGHAEIHHWVDSRTYIYTQDAINGVLETQPDNPDIMWMQDRTSVLAR